MVYKTATYHRRSFDNKGRPIDEYALDYVPDEVHIQTPAGIVKYTMSEESMERHVSISQIGDSDVDPVYLNNHKASSIPPSYSANGTFFLNHESVQ